MTLKFNKEFSGIVVVWMRKYSPCVSRDRENVISGTTLGGYVMFTNDFIRRSRGACHQCIDIAM